MTNNTLLGFATFALASALSAFAIPAALAAPYQEVARACDDMNKQKSGSCKIAPFSRQVLAGCAGNVCFECPVDSRRLCFAAPGRGGTFEVADKEGKLLKVGLSSSGTFVEAVTKGCDSFAEQKRGNCSYNIVTRTGVAGSTANVSFECPNKGECHALPGKGGKIGSTNVSP